MFCAKNEYNLKVNIEKQGGTHKLIETLPSAEEEIKKCEDEEMTNGMMQGVNTDLGIREQTSIEPRSSVRNEMRDELDNLKSESLRAPNGAHRHRRITTIYAIIQTHNIRTLLELLFDYLCVCDRVLRETRKNAEETNARGVEIFH